MTAKSVARPDLSPEEREVISESMSQLLRDLCRIYGEFPRRYVVTDTETTGFHHLDLIWGLGALLVEDGRVTREMDLVLNWADHPMVDGNWLEKRMADTREQMRAGGRRCHLDLHVLRDKGIEPEQALEQYGSLLLEARENKWPIVGHGIIKFDCQRIASHLEEWIGLNYKFRSTEVVDTAAIEKACLLNVRPEPKESFYNFSKRVLHKHSPAGVRWNIDHCFEKYGLAAKLDPSALHSAGGDAWVGYHLLEEYRRLSGV